MARLTLQLVVDPVTGARQVRVAYASDADALPMEHEAEHAALVERLAPGAAAQRERPAAAGVGLAAAEAAPEARKQST